MNTKRRVLSFLMALVMVLGVMAVLPMTVSAATITDVRTQLESYGFPSRNLTTFSTPNMDGVIDEDVYLTVNNAAGSNTNNATFAVTEYFAYDESRVYYAITLPDSVTSFYFNLFTLQDGVPNKSYYYRLQTAVTTTGVTYNGARNNDDGSAWQRAAAITQANIGFGYKNNADDTHTWELSYLISELCGASGASGALVRNFRYYVDLGSSRTLAYHLPQDLRTNDLGWNRNSFIGMNVNLSMENHDVDVRDLSAFGHAPLNVGFSTKALDVTDGVIDPADYTATRQIKAVLLQTATKGEHVTEYMTHDDEFIYMAFKIAGHDMDHEKGTSMSIWYTDSAVAADSGPFCETRFNFLPANKNGSGVIPVTAHGWLIGTGGGHVEAPSGGPETFAASAFAGAAKMDTDGTTGILEFKISKAALASKVGIDVVDFSNVRVKLNYRTTSGGNADGWHTGLYSKQPADMFALAVLDGAEDTGFSGTAGGYVVANSYNFVNTAPQSADVGSIRFGQGTDETSGLRFQTTVGKAFIAEKKAAGYTLTAGTIIAPADANIAELTDGVAGTDYLNVIADLDNPYIDGVTTVTFTGSIVNILPANLDRDFTAVGYIKLTKADSADIVIYSNAVTKNIAEIAEEAILDYEVDSAEYAYLNGILTAVQGN